jgi:hypothetical protein
VKAQDGYLPSFQTRTRHSRKHAALVSLGEQTGGPERSATRNAREAGAKGEATPKNRGSPTYAHRDRRDSTSLREVLRTTGAGGIGDVVAPRSADLGRGSDGGLLGRGVAVGGDSATVEAAL